MKTEIFDFNIHLADSVEEEQKLKFEDLEKIYKKNLEIYKKSFSGCNFMLFNSSLALKDITAFRKMVSQDFEEFTLTLLYDFHTKRSLEDLKSAGIDFIKFHSYVQRVDESYFQDIVEISKTAESLDLGILIDTSYGTLGLYEYDNLKLAVKILKVVKKVPVVLLHSGGAKALDAMLIALSSDNVYLESSFSLPFYKGSTIEKDLLFAYRNLKERVLYGSDYPYISFEESFEKTVHSLEENGFSKDDIYSIISKKL